MVPINCKQSAAKAVSFTGHGFCCLYCLSLHAGRGDALDDVLLEEEEDQERRDDRHRRQRKDLGVVLVAELLQVARQRGQPGRQCRVPVSFTHLTLPTILRV